MHQTTVLTELICRYQRQWNDFTSQVSGISAKMSRLHCITPWQGRKPSVLSEVALRAVKNSDGFVFLCRKHKNGFRLRFSPCGLRCSRTPPVSNHPFGAFGSFFADTKKAGCFHIPRILRLSPFFINENGFRLRFSPCGLRCSRTPPVSNHPFGVFGSFFADTKKAGCFHIPRILRLSPFFINENGSGTWIRTKDQVVNSHLLYR